MRKKKISTRKSRNLVLGFLERVSSKIFADYSKELTVLIGKQHGVYALYKGHRLYYVGLATNLRNRIKVHLNDKHKGKWDKFSLYLVRKADHIKELESIILRVSDPTGNATKGRLTRAVNLKKDLEKNIKKTQEYHLLKLLGSSRKRKKIKISKKEKQKQSKRH